MAMQPMTFILTFSIFSILILIGLVVYLCPPTTHARSRSFLAQQEEWLYLRRFPLPKEVMLLNFELFRQGALAEGQHALIIEPEEPSSTTLFDYVTVDDTLAKQTVILIRNKSLDSFILQAIPKPLVERQDAGSGAEHKHMVDVDTRMDAYRISTNQGFRAKQCIDDIENFLNDHPGICIEYIGNTLLLYKPNVCLSQEQVDTALSMARRLFTVLSR